MFDSCCFIDLFTHYYPSRFHTLWESFYQLVQDEKLVSVREARRELIDYGNSLSDWAKANSNVFHTPTADELVCVREIFEIKHFQAMIQMRRRLLGKPIADPFLIAKACNTKNGCVVTREKYKPNAAKIPNVCQHFDVPCYDLEEFMELEEWSF